MKRVITIIIIIIVIVSIFLSGAWLLSRRTAIKNSTAVPTFREFLTGDTGKGTGLIPNDGDLSSVFVDDNLGNTTAGDTTPTIGTHTSQFTNSTSAPSQGSGTTINGNTTTTTNPDGTITTTTPGPTPGTIIVTTVDTNGTTLTTTTTVDPTTITPVSVPPIATGPACSDADLNIQFSASDLAKLQALQNRFYALAQTLRSDADVATETGNHDNYKIKVIRANDLYNFCNAKIANIADPAYQKHVPTPFWHNSSTDTELLVSADGPYDGWISLWGSDGSFTADNYNGIPPVTIDLAQRTLERSLRLNLW